MSDGKSRAGGRTPAWVLCLSVAWLAWIAPAASAELTWPVVGDVTVPEGDAATTLSKIVTGAHTKWGQPLSSSDTGGFKVNGIPTFLFNTSGNPGAEHIAGIEHFAGGGIALEDDAVLHGAPNTPVGFLKLGSVLLHELWHRHESEYHHKLQQSPLWNECWAALLECHTPEDPEETGACAQSYALVGELHMLCCACKALEGHDPPDPDLDWKRQMLAERMDAVRGQLEGEGEGDQHSPGTWEECQGRIGECAAEPDVMAECAQYPAISPGAYPFPPGSLGAPGDVGGGGCEPPDVNDPPADFDPGEGLDPPSLNPGIGESGQAPPCSCGGGA